MALPTAVSFVLAAIAFLLATAGGGWMAAVSADTPGGSLLRRLIPVTLIVATVAGWLRLKGQALGWYEPALGTSILLVVLIVINSVALWINSRLVDRVDAEAQRHKEWLRVTLGSIGDAVIATDANARITFLNSIPESLTGWESHAALAQPIEMIFSLVNEQNGEPRVCPVAEVLQTGQTVGLSNHTALVSKNGTRTSIEDSAAPIKDATGDVIGVVMVYRDVTTKRLVEAQRRRAEETVRESEEQYRLLFNSMAEGFCTIEVHFDGNNRPLDYCFLEINPAFEKQTGLKNAKGRWIRELAPEHEQYWFDIYGKLA
jgi:PAS domain S-box-containing protein